MKSFHYTVWLLLFLFLAIMGGVSAIAFSRKSHACKIDPAQMALLRKK